MSQESIYRVYLRAALRAGWAFIKKLGPLVVPLSVFLVLTVVLASSRASVLWSDSALLQAAPHIVLTVACLLGAFFTQSRIFFLGLLIWVVLFMLERTYFIKHDLGKGATVVFLASVYIAPLMTLFFHLTERGIVTSHGGVRLMIILSAIIVILIVPQLDYFSRVAHTTESIFWGPMFPWMPLPFFGLLCFAICVPFLLLRNKHESPFLGRNMACSLLYIFVALNCKSTIWWRGSERAVELLYMTGAGFTLIWAVLESSWRHANIDELTELPGRRALKHHMARLGSVYAIAVIDVDFFKKINDKYGHDTGDQVLRFLASHLRKFPAGRIYRYGGEEFVMIFEGAASEDVVETTETIRGHIAESEFIVRGSNRPRRKPEGSKSKAASAEELRDRKIHITVSIGVATSKNYQSPHDVVQAADKALYRAKKDGRNCVKYSK